MTELSTNMGTIAGIVLIPFVLIWITLSMLKSIDMTKRSYTVWHPLQHAVVFALAMGVGYLYGGVMRSFILLVLPMLVVVTLVSVIVRFFMVKK